MKSPSSKYRILILTDHRIHSPVESIYSIARGLAKNDFCECVHVVSRGIQGNEFFFVEPVDIPLNAIEVDAGFSHSPGAKAFHQGQFLISPLNYDVVLLRLPRVSSMSFFAKIGKLIPEQKIINQPSGIAETGSKDYLLNFPELCPPIQKCNSIAEIEAFKSIFPIVLKPLNNSGGKGIVRIDGNMVYMGRTKVTWQEALPVIEEELVRGYLGMKYLKNVDQGDKRIIVVNGEVVAAALRLPAEGSWLCNVSMGGHSEMAEPDEAELEIAKRVVPNLLAKGVVMFGFDTLVDDKGNRVLSELNTSCVNGIYPAERVSGRPIVQRTVDLIMAYILNNIGKN